MVRNHIVELKEVVYMVINNKRPNEQLAFDGYLIP